SQGVADLMLLYYILPASALAHAKFDAAIVGDVLRSSPDGSVDFIEDGRAEDLVLAVGVGVTGKSNGG
ncbi:MAG TPA: hypothetical protein VJ787_05400, partial [Thermoleophilia bacterium]|nr:hypothetical protein [Thermoleophilia bacterium]